MALAVPACRTVSRLIRRVGFKKISPVNRSPPLGVAALLLAIASVASVVPAYRKCPPIQRVFRADRFCRRARNRSYLGQ